MSRRIFLISALWFGVVFLLALAFLLWRQQLRTYIAASAAAVLECAPVQNPCSSVDCWKPKPMEMT